VLSIREVPILSIKLKSLKPSPASLSLFIGGIALLIVPGTGVAQERAATNSLCALQVLNPNTGWAWGYPHGSFTLLKTINGGRNWSRISLPLQPPNYDSNNDQAGSSVYFLDEPHGWIGWLDSPTSSLRLLRTSNGGRDWQYVTSPVPPTVTTIKRIEFVTPDIGSILYLSSSGLSGAKKFLYNSQDGGKSWHNSSVNLPYPGTIVDIHFLSATDGWIALGNPASSDILLFRTADGGKTWHNMAKSLPVPKGYEHFNALSVSSPVFSDHTAGLLVVVFYAETQRYPVLYLTENGGDAWRPVVMKGFVNVSVNEMGSPAIFIDARDGWSFKDSTLYRTNDGGQTWRAIRSDSLRSFLNRYPNVRQLAFATREVGWILLVSKDGSQTRLLKSADAGSTWSAQ
jgi:photosystem II stability/assembly factor-like uncharacterized protein